MLWKRKKEPRGRLETYPERLYCEHMMVPQQKKFIFRKVDLKGRRSLKFYANEGKKVTRRSKLPADMIISITPSPLSLIIAWFPQQPQQ